MAARVVDALGREVVTPRPPRRIVSVVPSETESVARLAGIERLAGRSVYCEEPSGDIARVPTVGGTKRFDVEAVLALGPDLVLANQEENGRAEVEALIARGLTVHVSFPRSARDAAAYLESLVILLHLGEVSAHEEIAALRDAIARAEAEAQVNEPLPVFVPIWRDPWMTFNARTYGGDLLRLAGADNVFAGRARRYPLAADLGCAAPLDSERVGDRDTRYPRVSPEEIRAAAPAAILLPDEPYRFGPEDAPAIAALGAGVPVIPISGKDLFWYGVRTAAAIARLRETIARARSEACAR
jgi:ABC-type Fe3+-hydroxamate transport system substrate-binding protein